VFIDYAAGTVDASKIKDSFGNVLAPTELTVTTEADTTKPAVTNISYDATKGLINVDFSENVKNIATATFLVRNAQGTVVKSGATQGTTESKAVINTGKLVAGTYTVEIKGVEDKAVVANKMDDFSTSITVADTTAPAIATAVNTTGTTVRVTFTKDMNDADLINLANYTYDGAAFPAGTTGPVKVNARTVDITLPAATTGIVGKAVIASGTMKDLLGNAIGGFASAPATITAPASTAIVLADITKVKAIAKDKLQFTVKQALGGFDETKITLNSNPAKAVQYTNNANGTATVLVTLPDTEMFDTTGALKVVGTGTITKGLVLDGGALTNAFGVKNAAIAEIATFEDGVIAKIDSVETGDSNGNGQIDTLVVKFSEAVKAASVQATDFSVAGYTVKEVLSVGADGKVTLSLLESGSPDTGVTPKVTLVGEVEDLKGNKGFDASNQVAATDKAAPVVVGELYELATANTYVADDKITITFSEKIDASKIAIGDITAGKGSAGNTPDLDDSTLTPSTGDATELVITLKNSNTKLDLVSGNTLTIKNSKVEDKADTANPMAEDYVITLP
jgi:methionine-rich copper-binding protein CopC